MSRYIGEKNSVKVLSAADHWRKSCLEKEGSVFLNDSDLWMLPHFNDLEKYFINAPDDGDKNFFEKLEGQLNPTPTSVKQLAAEMLWVMFLCPSNISTEKKREGIQTIWQWSEKKLPENLPWLEDDILNGIGSSGTAYNTFRWREFAYFIRLMIAFKNQDRGKQEVLLGDGWEMAKWLEQIPENDNRQFRHMFLYLLFPDVFERIFGGTDRKKIVIAFSGINKAKINSLSALQIDEHLAAIRKDQTEELKQTELDFYVPPLNAVWEAERNVSWLFAWNPKLSSWDTFEEDREKTMKGETVTLRWSTASTKIMVGDKAFLARTGQEPKGIFAIGNIVAEPYEDAHWEEEKALTGKTAKYVKIEFSRIHDPLKGDPIITNDDLMN